MINGTLEMRGVAAIQGHYLNKIWPFFEEAASVGRFVLSFSHAGPYGKTTFLGLPH